MSRSENILVRVSKLEKKEINNNAKSFGLNKSNFIRNFATTINKLKMEKPSIKNTKLEREQNESTKLIMGIE